MLKHKEFLHGTDARILAMSKQERAKLRDICIRLSNALWEFYEPLLENHYGRGYGFQGIECYIRKFIENDGTYPKYYNLRDKLACWSAKRNGNLEYQYEYDCTYLTTEDWKACDYARRAAQFGEVGAVANTLFDGFTKIFPPSFVEHVKNIVSIADVTTLLDFVNGKAEPIILSIPVTSIDTNNLECADGKDINIVGNYETDFRYNSDLNLNNFGYESLDSFIKTRNVINPFGR